MSDESFASLFNDERLDPTRGGHVSDVLSIEEAWARFPLAMERANLGIGHLMERPGFVLRLWDDGRSMLAQADMTPREHEGHVRRALLRRRMWPLLIGQVTHLMERTGGKRAISLCGRKVDKRAQLWMESQDREVDCMACVATGRGEKPRHTKQDLEAMHWIASVKWMPNPGVWSRCGGSVSSHPRNQPGRYEGEKADDAPNQEPT
jgi:hypothetical protein